jgi:small subunit ribosomal protein S16
MPVRIRLARHGRKSRPFYYIVVADSRAPRDGKFIERIGSYNPVTNPATLELDFDKALDWVQKGALPSDTARNLLQQKGVMYKNHLLKGVKKGALNEEQAEQKFEDWISQKEDELDGVVQKLQDEQATDAKSRLAAETKIRESMAAELAKKRSDLVAAEEELEEAAPEVAEEQVETQETAPVVAEETPAVAKEVPAEKPEEAKPAEEKKAPVEEKKAPAEAKETPVEEKKTSAEEKKAPVEEKETPKEEKVVEEKAEKAKDEKKEEEEKSAE